jgi:hypothetical protein
MSIRGLAEEMCQSLMSLDVELDPLIFHSITERYLLLAMSEVRLHLQITLLVI